MTALRWAVLGALLLAAVLVPFIAFEAAVSEAVDRFLASDPPRLTLASVTALAMASDLFLPIPSSVLATSAGALLGLPLGAASSFVGLTLGCMVGHAIGSAGRSLAARVVGDDQIAVARRLFARRGDAVVAVLRPIPVLAEVSVVVAGLSAMPRRRFLLYTGLANAGIATAYAALGAWAAQVDALAVAAAGSLVLPGLAMLLGRRATRDAAAGSPEPGEDA